jgi:hypothetical protein
MNSAGAVQDCDLEKVITSGWWGDGIEKEGKKGR